MDVQLILVLALFGIALVYLIRTVYLNIKPSKKGGACKTCSACSDFAEPVKKKANVIS
jgi:hypothetical protein